MRARATQSALTSSDIERDAVFSRCGTYRYALTRRWAACGPRVCWLMLNPSTADAARDDPTIRRCIGFSQRWGAASLVVVNLFAFRATQPSVLARAERPVGPRNASHVRAAMAASDWVVCAWGAHPVAHRSVLREQLLRDTEGLHCLGYTRAGEPRHPLYVAYGATPQAWTAG